MSTEKRVTFNEHGEPTVVVTITGWDDSFRFAWAMAHLQCDFSDVGRRIAGSLRRKLGAKRFREWQHKFTGKRTLTWVRDDPPEVCTCDFDPSYSGGLCDVCGLPDPLYQSDEPEVR